MVRFIQVGFVVRIRVRVRVRVRLCVVGRADPTSNLTRTPLTLNPLILTSLTRTPLTLTPLTVPLTLTQQH